MSLFLDIGQFPTVVSIDNTLTLHVKQKKERKRKRNDEPVNDTALAHFYNCAAYLTLINFLFISLSKVLSLVPCVRLMKLK